MSALQALDVLWMAWHGVWPRHLHVCQMPDTDLWLAPGQHACASNMRTKLTEQRKLELGRSGSALGAAAASLTSPAEMQSRKQHQLQALGWQCQTAAEQPLDQQDDTQSVWLSVLLQFAVCVCTCPIASYIAKACLPFWNYTQCECNRCASWGHMKYECSQCKYAQRPQQKLPVRHVTPSGLLRIAPYHHLDVHEIRACEHFQVWFLQLHGHASTQAVCRNKPDFTPVRLLHA